MSESMIALGKRAKAVQYQIASLPTARKNEILLIIKNHLIKHCDTILEQNQIDIANAEANGIAKVMIDRLSLNKERIAAIGSAIETVIELDDPVGKIDGGCRRPNGLTITKTRVPLGVVGIIFESRPNVTVDAAALCIKSGNVALLRGGKEAICTNRALVAVMRKAIASCGVAEDLVLLVEDTSRESATAMMKLNHYLDVLIPRGGAGLIRSVVENATVPVIETGTGNCHIYVDETADLNQAAAIVNNAKTSRPSVCNACESLLVHETIAKTFLPMVKQELDRSNVEILGCEQTRKILGEAVLPATEQDYATEFLDYKISVKVVKTVEEAVDHINTYSTKHSEAILTNRLDHANYFTAMVDAAAVYVNASTRFTDGGEFGLGAEIGISTQKLHARGPMGLQELTTIKYLVQGNGQIRV